MPFFLCLDEMNLAPVEQYFAQYLSVVETRHLNKNGVIESDPIIKLEKKYCDQLADMLYPQSDSDEDGANRAKLKEKFKNMKYEIPLPKNLIVMGTVNMDETTFGFSRKVLDRAMTIEMNEVDLAGGLEDTDKERFGIAAADILPTAVEGKDVYAENKELCDKVIGYLQQVNDVLEDTPFKIAYRTRNEFLVYAVNRGEDNLTEALDEMTSMKILSRIEGDQDKVGHVLEGLEQVMMASGLAEDGLSRKKVKAMAKRLNSGYTSYWN
ncbi:MAG: hypothetical protein KBT28_12120 [Bacteroidales bacterium]|nr:hypothetical protein [Candidatus Colimorpha merdihippi]